MDTIFSLIQQLMNFCGMILSTQKHSLARTFDPPGPTQKKSFVLVEVLTLLMKIQLHWPLRNFICYGISPKNVDSSSNCAIEQIRSDNHFFCVS